MMFAEQLLQPGHETSIRVNADRQSLCAFGVVDKSVELMGKPPSLTADKVCSVDYQLESSSGDSVPIVLLK